LKTGITLDNFRAYGTLPNRNDLLKSIFNGVDKTHFSSFRMSTDILKGPVAFPGFHLEISFSISSVVVG